MLLLLLYKNKSTKLTCEHTNTKRRYKNMIRSILKWWRLNTIHSQLMKLTKLLACMKLKEMATSSIHFKPVFQRQESWDKYSNVKITWVQTKYFRRENSRFWPSLCWGYYEMSWLWSKCWTIWSLNTLFYWSRMWE